MATERDNREAAETVIARAKASVERKDAETTKLAVELDFVKGLAGDVKDVIVWMLKSAASNPLMGFIGGVVIVDILFKNKIITPVGYAAAMVAIGAFDGLAIATSISDLTSGNFSVLWGAISATKTPPTFDLFAPTAQVLTYGDTEASPSPASPPPGAAGIASMLGGLASKVLPAAAETALAVIP